MLIIRREQISAFHEVAYEILTGAVRDHVARNCAGAVSDWPESVLDARVRLGIKRARSHGLTWSSTITAFVALMVEISPKFDEHPAVREALDRGDRESADRQMEALGTAVPDAVWDELERARHSVEWIELED